VVQESVLEREDDGDLAVYVVWEPIFRTDDERAARKASTLLTDRRVAHFWVETQAIGQLFQPAIGLEGEVAWDVYLVYPPGIGWEDRIPPVPEILMHQLRGRLPEARLLDGPVLAQDIDRVLSR